MHVFETNILMNPQGNFQLDVSYKAHTVDALVCKQHAYRQNMLACKQAKPIPGPP